MTEYINTTTLLKEIDHAFHTDTIGKKDVINLIINLPVADVTPVLHGRWESVKNPQWPAYSHDKCSLCGWWNTKNALCYDGRQKPGHALNYCPNCGVRMDGGDD